MRKILVVAVLASALVAIGTQTAEAGPLSRVVRGMKAVARVVAPPYGRCR